MGAPSHSGLAPFIIMQHLTIETRLTFAFAIIRARTRAGVWRLRSPCVRTAATPC
ncbi:hypothetical protein BN2497_3739 [Janthinobacterium sp. CG23_2]|nr:hypothetical protein BN2497_3739 [Janthinobacterium sp. CG23_2]CUU28267.1 hypothetical protein BN3177_3739 [Janthinobacterium sp. CG23_2]